MARTTRQTTCKSTKNLNDEIHEIEGNENLEEDEPFFSDEPIPSDEHSSDEDSDYGNCE